MIDSNDIQKLVDRITILFFVGVLFFGLSSGGGYALIYGTGYIISSVSDFVKYDIYNEDRPTYETIMAPSIDLDDCHQSDDPQLCHQMKRLADNFDNFDNFDKTESTKIIEESKNIVIDTFDSENQKKLVLMLMYGNNYTDYKVNDDCFVTITYHEGRDMLLDCDEDIYTLTHMHQSVEWCNSYDGEHIHDYLTVHTPDVDEIIYDCYSLLKELQDYDHKTPEIGIGDSRFD